MKLVEIRGDLYNLDQFVSLIERPKKHPAWKDEDENTEIVLTFASGITVNLSATERDAVKQRIRDYAAQQSSTA